MEIINNIGNSSKNNTTTNSNILDNPAIDKTTINNHTLDTHTINKTTEYYTNDIEKTIKIRAMNISDLNSIKDILLTDFDDFWNYNIFKSELENENCKYIVATLNDEIIGFAGIWQVVDEAHITNIVTKKTHRNQGIGNLLLENLINICKNLENINLITLEVNEENIIAQKLYKKFGFGVVGKRKKYYNNEKSAIIMTIYLDC